MVSIRSRLFSREIRSAISALRCLETVSIRSRLFSREIHAFYGAGADEELVSIRSRLFSREIHPVNDVTEAHQVPFQSAPGFLAGRYGVNFSSIRQGTLVSIRSRLFSREIHVSNAGFRGYAKFQSAPGFLAGRYVLRRDQQPAQASFNPLPAF